MLNVTKYCNCNRSKKNELEVEYINEYCEVCERRFYYIFPNQGECDLKDDSSYEFPVLEKKDWKPEVHLSSMEEKAKSMIKKAFLNCGEDFPDFRFTYVYTQIQTSPSDPSRLSGVGWHYFQKKAFDNGPWTRASELDMEYNYAVNAWLPKSYVTEHGTYLKPAKLIRALDPGLSESKVTCIASKLADMLRLACGMIEEVQVTDTPSEIYALRGKFYSCMSGRASSYFQLYDECSTISIAYIKREGYLVGRALLHENVEVNGNYRIKLMDRIYSDDCYIEALFKKWAIANGYCYKESQSAGTTSYVNTEGEVEDDPTLRFTYAPDLEFDAVPYMDTFQYYESNKGSFNTNGYGTCLTSTEGTDSDNIITPSRYCCARCNCNMSEDEGGSCPNGDRYCDECYSEEVSYCECCENDVWRDYMRPVSDGRVCDNCRDNHYTRCGCCGEYIENSDLIETVDGYNLCSDCADDVYECDECAGVMYNEKLFSTESGDKLLCHDCRDKYDACTECGDLTKNSNEVCNNCEVEVVI